MSRFVTNRRQLLKWSASTFGAALVGQFLTSSKAFAFIGGAFTKSRRSKLGVPGALFNWGNGTTSPVQLHALKQWTKLTAGEDHWGMIASNGTLWCWGVNYLGAVGNGSFVAVSSPLQIGSATNWKQVKMGMQFTLALKTDGTLWSWGDNSNLQLAGGSTRSSPVQVGSLTDWNQLTCGYYHGAAIKADGTLWTWGSNVYGELGRGTSGSNIGSPVQVGSNTDWIAIEAGDGVTFGIRADRSLWSWGDGGYGRLGLGTTVSRSSPVQVGALTNWKSISAKVTHAAAIKVDGSLWTWGSNSNGQLGIGTAITGASSPVQVGSLKNWVMVKTAHQFTMALQDNGTLWAWGINTSGELGIGGTASKSSPTQIGVLTTWTDFAITFQKAIATKT